MDTRAFGKVLGRNGMRLRDSTSKAGTDRDQAGPTEPVRRWLAAKLFSISALGVGHRSGPIVGRKRDTPDIPRFDQCYSAIERIRRVHVHDLGTSLLSG